MDCQTYLDQIAAHVDDALGADDTAAAREHLARCPACAAKYRWEAAVKGTLQAKLPIQEPNPFLRQRILARLEDARPPQRLWGLSFALKAAAGAATVLLLFLPYYLLQKSNEQPNFFSNIVVSYQQAKQGVRSEEPPFTPSAMLLDLSPWGYRLLSRSTDTVDGRPARVSVYQGEDRSFLMAQEFDDSGIPIPEGARVVNDGANSFFTYERAGVNLIAWRERGIFCVIASSQTEADLLALAKRIVVRG